jgi:hypothetical protein
MLSKLVLSLNFLIQFSIYSIPYSRRKLHKLEWAGPTQKRWLYFAKTAKVNWNQLIPVVALFVNQWVNFAYFLHNMHHPDIEK